MQRESSGRDRILLDDITGLQERTDKREQKVADVTEKLHEELVLLAQFLSSMVQRRPQSKFSNFISILLKFVILRQDFI